MRILVTGANKGIGLAIARGVLAHGEDTTLLLGSRDAGRGAAAKATLAGEQPGWDARIEVVPLGVTDEGSVAAALAQIRGGGLDVLVHNAGIAHGSMREILDVNLFGLRRVTEALLPLLAASAGGRIVNVTSASGPNFVADCRADRQRELTDAAVTWTEIERLADECLALEASGGDFEAAGFGGGSAYGLSKATANAYTLVLAREHPGLRANACTPGFIETDLTRPWAVQRGVSPAAMGMKTPDQGARAPLKLAFDALEGNGRYYGSDGLRSPLDRYRAPGDPAFEG
ncbi:MAG: SDR family NAD(P)-dependent oxidoreductase [Myxococcota bacterium]